MKTNELAVLKNFTLKNKMKKRIFEAPSGQKVETANKHDIAMMKKCGWREIKEPKDVFAKNLTNGNNFLK